MTRKKPAIDDEIFEQGSILLATASAGVIGYFGMKSMITIGRTMNHGMQRIVEVGEGVGASVIDEGKETISEIYKDPITGIWNNPLNVYPRIWNNPFNVYKRVYEEVTK